MPQLDQHVLPRWRGFNLLEMFTAGSDGNWQEDDFRWISDWGFDFVRFPLCYTLWIENNDPLRLSELGLAKVDRAVELARKYKLHVCLNFHRAPGYSVNPERQEPFNLWKEETALEAFCLHWSALAYRYRGVPGSKVSFDLVNEPPAPSATGMTRADNERVVRAAVGAIRAADPQRLILADGLSWGNEPMPELADLKIGQSCRAYAPMEISHYQAPWVGGERYALPHLAARARRRALGPGEAGAPLPALGRPRQAGRGRALRRGRGVQQDAAPRIPGVVPGRAGDTTRAQHRLGAVELPRKLRRAGLRPG